MRNCMDHMWVENSACEGDDKYGVYGNKCSAGQYNSKCELVAC